MTTLPAGWKPIESAPKDGSLILLGCPDEGPDGRPALCLPGHWLNGWGDAPDEKGQDDGWVAVTFNDFYPGRSFGNPDYMYQGSQPTHWMPLPAAPCLTCNGHGMVGGLTQHSGYDAEPCPECTPPASAQDDAKDEDSIALDKLADYIADNWPDKKYGLGEISQLLHATWPATFMPAAPGAPPATSQDDPITVSLDPDHRGVSVGVWQGSRCIYNGAHAVPVSAQDDAKDEQDEWMTCETRGRMVADSLARNARVMRACESDSRNAYRKEYMAAPTRYLADVYAAAAAVFEAKLAALAVSQQQEG